MVFKLFLASLLLLASLLIRLIVGIPTVAGVPAIAGLPSAVYACDVPIVSAAVHPTVSNVLVTSSCCCYCP
jgi:hypothetical protein